MNREECEKLILQKLKEIDATSIEGKVYHFGN